LDTTVSEKSKCTFLSLWATSKAGAANRCEATEANFKREREEIEIEREREREKERIKKRIRCKHSRLFASLEAVRQN
jgi:hypothetical protein